MALNSYIFIQNFKLNQQAQVTINDGTAKVTATGSHPDASTPPTVISVAPTLYHVHPPSIEG